MDKEFEVLEYISSSDDVTQRDISEYLGISLGSVNLLLKKMIREGLIKIEKIPANRVAYMLTPKGIQEKISKTFSYIKIHYRAIENFKIQIRNLLKNLNEMYDVIYFMIEDDGINNIFNEISRLNEFEKIRPYALITIEDNICIKNSILIYDNEEKVININIEKKNLNEIF